MENRVKIFKETHSGFLTKTSFALSDFYRWANEYKHSKKENFRRNFFHGGEKNDPKRHLAISCFDFCTAFLENPNLKQKILVVDNALDDETTKVLEFIHKHFKEMEFYLLDSKFEELKNKNPELSKIEKLVLDGVGFKWQGTEKSLHFDDFDLVLQDLYLGEGEIQGEDLLFYYMDNSPQVPVFVFSIMEDFDLIREVLKRGADYFIPKRLTIGIPHNILKYQERLGKLLLLFSGSDDGLKLKKSLMGNVRKWLHDSDYLWFGDKCYHMIDHSLNHTLNDWKNMDDLLYPILKEKQKGENDDAEKNVLDFLLKDENLYSLCMAVWLHDIGHKGNRRHGESYLIRDNHGIISGELLLAQPDLFGVKDNNVAYKDMVFPFGPQEKPVTQMIREHVEKKRKDMNKVGLSILEKIALLSIYHKSNSPLSKEDYQQMVIKDKDVPTDFFQNSDRNKNEITLDDIVNGDDKFLTMAALFRFIDSLDIKKNRVGDEKASRHKKRIIQQDKEYQKKMLLKEVENMSKVGQGDEATRLAFFKTFYLDVVEKIDRGESVSHLELRKVAPKDVVEQLENYFARVNYASFISVQDGHFDLHSSIEKVEIKVEDNSTNPVKIKIHYISGWGKEQLEKEKVVKELSDKEKKSVREHLIGTKEKEFKDGYVIREWDKGKEWLKIFKIEQIVLETSDKYQIIWEEGREGVEWGKA